MRPSGRLRALLHGGDVVVAPGVWDGLSARLVARAGFAAVYATGGGIARSMGYPDLGLVSMTEVVSRLALIVEQAGVPVIADADTGYGGALNTRRAVRECGRASRPSISRIRSSRNGAVTMTTSRWSRPPRWRRSSAPRVTPRTTPTSC